MACALRTEADDARDVRCVQQISSCAFDKLELVRATRKESSAKRTFHRRGPRSETTLDGIERDANDEERMRC